MMYSTCFTCFRHLKIYDIQDYSVVHSIDYPSPILSVAMSVSQFSFLFCLIHMYRSLLEAVHLCTTVSLTVPLSICV